jgi:Fur family ferric uptake transcriptional regulator
MDTLVELRNNGLKVTAPRLKILEIFRTAGRRHLTAEDVYRLLLAGGADVGLATVYRVLTQFEQASILARNHFEAGKAVYELRQKRHHDHLVCLDCGRVEEFYDAEIEKRQAAAAARQGFVIADHALSLYAHCSRQACPHRALSVERVG